MSNPFYPHSIHKSFSSMGEAIQWFIAQGVWRIPEITFSGDFGQSDDTDGAFGTVAPHGPSFIITASGAVSVCIDTRWITAQSGIDAYRIARENEDYAMRYQK